MADERVAHLNQRLLNVAGGVRVLSYLTWPQHVVVEFLGGWRKGAPSLPNVTLARADHRAECAELDAIVQAADRHDPLQDFIADTAESYATAARMLDHVGTQGFVDRSRAIYGAPDDLIPGTARTHRDAAEGLLTHTDSLAAAGVRESFELCVTAETVQRELQSAFSAFFDESAPEVVLDPELASKAAAGTTRVRIRAETCFSELDIAQLIEHEGFVHTGTALNGRSQPVLSCMGLGAPRTTLTQEGLATMAELITRSIDIARLRRLALRTVAIHHALDGADFLDVFRFFLEAGQSDEESARSAMRVFRGGDVRGRIAFTKDVVYLCGLIGVHTFLRKAIAESRPHLVRRLFTGRMALSDVFRFDQAFAEGRIVEPRFVPKWATDLHRLAAYLAFSAIIHQIDLGSVELESLLGS